MSNNIHSLNSYGYVINRTPNSQLNKSGIPGDYTAGENRRNLLRGLKSSDSDSKDSGIAAAPKSILEESLSYSQSIRDSRIKSKDTSNAVKKVKYAYKSVSMSILRAKNSTSARMAASKAARVVSDLKRKLKSGQYDEEELMLNIEHAKAMERVARKKAKNLMIEEIAEKNKKDDGKSSEEPIDAARYERDMEELAENTDNNNDNNENANNIINIENTGSTGSVENSADLLSDIEAMEMLDDYEIMDLMQELEELNNAYSGMSKEDIAMMKAKHRADENKEIAKADTAYFKAVMEKLEASKHHYTPAMGGGGTSMSSAPSSAPVPSSASVPSAGSVPTANPVSVANVSPAVSAAPVVSAGVDVCL